MKTKDIRTVKKDELSTTCTSAQHAEMIRNSDADEPCDVIKKEV